MPVLQNSSITNLTNTTAYLLIGNKSVCRQKSSPLVSASTLKLMIGISVWFNRSTHLANSYIPHEFISGKLSEMTQKSHLAFANLYHFWCERDFVS